MSFLNRSGRNRRVDSISWALEQMAERVSLKRTRTPTLPAPTTKRGREEHKGSLTTERHPTRGRRTFVKAEFLVPAAMVDEAAGILAIRGALGCAAQWPHKAKRSPHAPVTLEA